MMGEWLRAKKPHLRVTIWSTYHHIYITEIIVSKDASINHAVIIIRLYSKCTVIGGIAALPIRIRFKFTFEKGDILSNQIHL